MKKFSIFIFFLIGGTLFSQWSPIEPQKGLENISNRQNYYKLNIDVIKAQLKNAQETGKNAKAVEILLPTLEGKIERFSIYSFPVLAKELADEYQLGSYVGVGIDDPSKYVRFSIAPNDFQSMIIKNGESEFIEPQDQDKAIYVVHPRSKGNRDFTCGIDENPISIKQLEQLREQGKIFTHQPTDFSKSSDQKFRTMRLVVSTTGDYTAFHGGTVEGAITAINATMTRVNGVLEKDFALHLDVQNFPQIIYTDPDTDPYSVDGAGNSVWNLELQNVLTNSIGNVNYDIGHLFVGHQSPPFAGNAGCIGCICVDPDNNFSTGKGSAFSSSNTPQGDIFDLTIVAHEFGHQLGANHTFSNNLEEGTGTNVEPGSGFTIMSYGGSDIGPYYHYASINQVQNNLNNTTCDIETSIINNPPVIEPLPPPYTIPKGTAFVLSASVNDPEGDPMTYSWEQMDNAQSPITDVTGNNTTGALFRSLPPGTSPTRYFPKLSSVLNGNLIVPSDWEAVPNVSRLMVFALTVRDNNAIASQQQTQSALQLIIVNDDGPFKINSTQVDPTIPYAVKWDVANTNAVPYNVSNVKIDYTIDNGVTWDILSSSTPNDGEEYFFFPISLNNHSIKLRISAIDNIFYAIQKIFVTNGICDTVPPINIEITNITSSSAVVSWDPIGSANYLIRYKKSNDTSWEQTTSTTNMITINNLNENSSYDIQVATECSGIASDFSNILNFSTPFAYCETSSLESNDYISNINLANVSNSSGPSPYTSYAEDPALQIDLTRGSNYTLSVTKAWQNAVSRPDMISAWIDFNNDGEFDITSERIMEEYVDAQNPIISNFTVPTDALLNKKLRMRIILSYDDGLGLPIIAPCGSFDIGEVEDYSVIINDFLSTINTYGAKSEIQLYPNPVDDRLMISNVSNHASYIIYNALGQLVDNGSIFNNEINVSSLAQGVYSIVVVEKRKNLMFKSKFIKK
ncbi:T9SS C-terminal target domain-containing protein [Chryseobacterium nematophagum]|uniref:T9SS C-terminal target domain-containing protein n=1 Tax=Chryseobacterium nematophagum TaxID=2305228 RepID=A0A3M7TEW8_9FLAO|nr:zinc-dependent metalloprotease family protein [Chryseobacterium nematophagum]RNA61427.1 T9SS C-terminal target domain-containing protein [Chryseobacterium nematophagum]